ncbi:MAG TPA: YncE family protein [Candidatus Kapabacteria bacterium]|nr:YncE family protein [Candidatus Kapabacteria bacterium]
MRSVVLILFFIGSIPAVSLAHESGQYHLLKKYTLGGEGGWDYVAFDNSSDRIFIARATHVVVFDVNAEKVVGDIPNTIGVHGVTFAPKFNHGFVSCGKMNSVLMFDLKTLDTLKRIPAGIDPDPIIYDPFSKTILVCNGHGNSATVIDAATGNVKRTIELGSAPEYAVTDEKGKVFINLEDESKVVAVDMRTFKIIRRMNLASGKGPTGLAMDRKTHRLFDGCANERMMILNSDNGKIVATLPIGKDFDAVIFDPEKKLATCACGEGTLTLIREVTPDKFEVVGTLATQAGARTEAMNPKTHDLYLITSDLGPAPEPTKENPHPRPSIIPNTFVLLKYGY